MNIELEYINVEYTEKDLHYINILTKKVDIDTREIASFFSIKNLNPKINLKIFNDISQFRYECSKTYPMLDSNGNLPESVCTYLIDNNIYVLTYDEFLKIKDHHNYTLDDLLRLILQEFVYYCFRNKKCRQTYPWLEEGLALTLSHQYDDSSINFTATYDEIIYGGATAQSYYAMFKYVLDFYGNDYIKLLISDFDLLETDTPKLYEEAKEKYSKK